MIHSTTVYCLCVISAVKTIVTKLPCGIYTSDEDRNVNLQTRPPRGDVSTSKSAASRLQLSELHQSCGGGSSSSPRNL
ncbi:hypothetical protein L195_g035778, partial [Trifolium pratense]